MYIFTNVVLSAESVCQSAHTRLYSLPPPPPGSEDIPDCIAYPPPPGSEEVRHTYTTTQEFSALMSLRTLDNVPVKYTELVVIGAGMSDLPLPLATMNAWMHTTTHSRRPRTHLGNGSSRVCPTQGNHIPLWKSRCPSTADYPSR